jgi:hypothetical protein
VFALWLLAFYAVRRLGKDWLPGYLSPGLASDIRDFSPILFVGLSGALGFVGRRYELVKPSETSRSPAAGIPPQAR